MSPTVQGSTQMSPPQRGRPHSLSPDPVLWASSHLHLPQVCVTGFHPQPRPLEGPFLGGGGSRRNGLWRAVGAQQVPFD